MCKYDIIEFILETSLFSLTNAFIHFPVIVGRKFFIFSFDKSEFEWHLCLNWMQLVQFCIMENILMHLLKNLYRGCIDAVYAAGTADSGRTEKTRILKSIFEKIFQILESYIDLYIKELVFATNSNFLIPISLQPCGVNL